MKNTLFLATYFNNAHFIKIQDELFRKFIKDEYEFAVVDDSTDSARSIVSGKLAKEDIPSECSIYGARHIKVPQSVHAFFRDGGYVPNPENYHAPDINHPTNRQQAVIRWLIANHKTLGFDQYKTLVIMDADILIRKPIKITEYFNTDLLGTGRKQFIDLPLTTYGSQFFTDRIKTLDKSYISFYNTCLLFINMQKVTNFDQFDIGTWPETDTGSKTNFFIKDNPQYNCAFIGDKYDKESQIDILIKLTDNTGEINLNKVDVDTEAAEIIHFRASSNWNYDTSEFYKAKLNRMLKKHIPELNFSFDDIGGDIKSVFGNILKG